MAAALISLSKASATMSVPGHKTVACRMCSPIFQVESLWTYSDVGAPTLFEPSVHNVSLHDLPFVNAVSMLESSEGLH